MSSEERNPSVAPTVGYLREGVVLAVLTVVVAAGLVPFNIGLGRELANNPEDNAQLAMQWSEAAVLGYTSGSEVGWTLALVAGLLTRRWAASRKLDGPVAALLPGIVLGLAGMAAAAAVAIPRLSDMADEAGNGMYEDIGHPLIDPGLTHHGTTMMIMILAFALYVGSSGIGYAAAASEPAVDAPVLVPLFLVGAVIVRLGGAMMMGPGLFPS